MKDPDEDGRFPEEKVELQNMPRHPLLLTEESPIDIIDEGQRIMHTDSSPQGSISSHSGYSSQGGKTGSDLLSSPGEKRNDMKDGNKQDSLMLRESLQKSGQESTPLVSGQQLGNEQSPGPYNLKEEMVKSLSVKDVLQKLETNKNGLSEEEAHRRLLECGPNALPEVKRNPLWVFLSFLWNPLAWAMEAAAIISIALVDYADFILILFLLLLNASIGFVEEHNAGNAIAALKAQLAPQSKVIREGVQKSIQASELVPGDVVRVRLGDVIPADMKIISDDSIKIDQSSLTGESLPVSKYSGQQCYSGSICKQGEATGVVYGTGMNTFFGKAAQLMNATENEGHLQEVLKNVGNFCLISIAIWVFIELIVQFAFRSTSIYAGRLSPLGLNGNLFGKNLCSGGVDRCPTLNNLLVLIVGGIPVAMPTVLSVTMAIGATRLSKRQAIVSRLTAVEELAGMDVLCSDKTGTLTLNHLSIDQTEIFPIGGHDAWEVLLDAALAARYEDGEPIDVCVVESLGDRRDELKTYTLLHYTPFDPVSKRTIAKLQDSEGRIVRMCKGAPQIVMKMAHNLEEIRESVQGKVNEFAERGYRALGVSQSEGDLPLEECSWEFIGLLPLFDPPRHDTAETIQHAIDMGILVKMITGDQLAIAKETAKQLGMRTDIHTTHVLTEAVPGGQIELNQLIERSDGFAEVFPEHKFEIVRRLQDMKHIVGMTGDGVNDAPALKKADIGIAVAGATDAARAAADIVLLAPGLSVIIDAIRGSRKIFQRMKNYAQYSIAMTIRITFTFGLLTTIFNWYFPTILIVILAILNDGTILSISTDRVKPSERPDAWRLSHLFIVSTIYGLYLALSSIILFVLASQPHGVFASFGALALNRDTYEGASRLRGLIYLQVSISGQALIFVTRSKGFSFLDRPSWPLLMAFVVAQTAATLIGVYGFHGYPDYDIKRFAIGSNTNSTIWGRYSFLGIGWGYALIVWVWCIIWYIPLDFIKFGIGFLSSRRVKSYFNRTTFNTQLNFGNPYYGQHPIHTTF